MYKNKTGKKMKESEKAFQIEKQSVYLIVFWLYISGMWTKKVKGIDKREAEEFLQYFARINGIDIDSVTEKNGALIRNGI